MADQPSEEKTLQPSQRKLRKAREKGQVVTSRETILSLTGIAGIVYIYAMRGNIAEKFMALWVLEVENSDRGFATALRDKLGIVVELGMLIVLPIFLLVITVSVLGGMVVSGGPLFSTHPITPDFDRINPASGFKRIFAGKAMLKFLMHVLRLFLLAGIFGIILFLAWGAMISAPVCGLPCAAETMSGVLLPMAVGGVTIMAAMAAFDYLVNRHSFIEDQKMTQTEYKREMKDMMGDPQMRGALRRERRQMAEVRTGARHAIVVVAAPPRISVGVRFVQDETPAPVIVAKARGGDAMRQLANASTAPEVHDPGLAETLWRIGVGSYVVDEDTIQRLVPHLQQALAGQQGGG